MGEIFNRMKRYSENGSGLLVLSIEKLELNITKFKRDFFKRWEGAWEI